MVYTQHYRTTLGKLTLASDGIALVGLWFDGQKHFGANLGAAREETSLPVFRAATRWLSLYFAGEQPDFLPPLAPQGTPFQKSVWAILRTIPYGQTMTYGEIAAQIARQRGTGMSAQAIGGAVGRNPIAILIPCHRVIGADGSLTGYAAGIERKRELLALEGVELHP